MPLNIAAPIITKTLIIINAGITAKENLTNSQTKFKKLISTLVTVTFCVSLIMN